MKKPQTSLAVLFALSFTVPGLAAKPAWPELEGLKFASYVGITVENPSDADTSAALFHIPMAELAKIAPDARPGQVALMDVGAMSEAKAPPKRDAADQWFIPTQESGGDLIFSVPLKAHASRRLTLGVSPSRANMPGFAMGTGYDARHAYRSFENRHAAFRFETGPGANTTGMTIDLFGKTAAGTGLRLAELYQAGHDSYHDLQYWGVDILKVGLGPGMGGLYLFSGDASARPSYLTTLVEPVYIGPVETLLRVTGPVELAGKKYVITREITIVADDRSLRDKVTISGDDLSNIQLGVGIRDLPNCKWVEEPDKGIAFMTGDANQAHYKAVGIGCVFPPGEFVRMMEKTPDPKEPGHVYILKGHLEGKALVSEHRLTDIWDMDGQLAKPVNTAPELAGPLHGWLSAYAAQRDHPPTFKLGTSAENAP